jgi:hypothetical protein
MSDYMTEIEQIKKEITELHFGPCDLNPEGMSVEKFNFYVYARQRFDSLITTIESLQKEVKNYKWEDEQFSWLQEQIKTCSSENQSLRAITELAVKGFQMLKAMSSKDDIPPALYNTASWYLDEIANLEIKR